MKKNKQAGAVSYSFFEKKTLEMFKEYLSWQTDDGNLEHTRDNVRRYFVMSGKRNIDLIFYAKGLLSLQKKIKNNQLGNEELILCQALSKALEKK